MEFSSHGKIIWCGEHACVYGHPAVMSDLNLRVSLRVSDDSKYNNNYDYDFVNKLVADYLGVSFRPVGVLGDLVPGVGLGFSSALISALIKFYTESDSVDVDQVTEIERKINPLFSGVDSFMCNNEGVYLYSDKGFVRRNDLFFDYFLIDTGCEDSSSLMVDNVAGVIGKDEIFEGITHVVSQFNIGLTYNDIGLIEEAVVLNSDLLVELGVVDALALGLIDYLSREGFVSKVTGAGGRTHGSGCVLGVGKLSADNRKHIEDDLGFKIVYES